MTSLITFKKECKFFNTSLSVFFLNKFCSKPNLFYFYCCFSNAIVKTQSYRNIETNRSQLFLLYLVLKNTKHLAKL